MADSECQCQFYFEVVVGHEHRYHHGSNMHSMTWTNRRDEQRDGKEGDKQEAGRRQDCGKTSNQENETGEGETRRERRADEQEQLGKKNSRVLLEISCPTENSVMVNSIDFNSLCAALGNSKLESSEGNDKKVGSTKNGRTPDAEHLPRELQSKKDVPSTRETNAEKSERYRRDGNTFLKRGDYESALDQYSRALNCCRNSPQAPHKNFR